MASCADPDSEQRVADGDNIILADFFSVNGNFPALVIGDRCVNNTVLSGIQRAGYFCVGKAFDIQHAAVELVVALNEFVSIKTVDKEVECTAVDIILDGHFNGYRRSRLAHAEVIDIFAARVLGILLVTDRDKNIFDSRGFNEQINILILFGRDGERNSSGAVRRSLVVVHVARIKTYRNRINVIEIGISDIEFVENLIDSRCAEEVVVLHLKRIVRIEAPRRDIFIHAVGYREPVFVSVCVELAG